MKKFEIEIPEGKRAEWKEVDGHTVLELVDEEDGQAVYALIDEVDNRPVTSEPLADYFGKQFIDIWAGYIFQK